MALILIVRSKQAAAKWYACLLRAASLLGPIRSPTHRQALGGPSKLLTTLTASFGVLAGLLPDDLVPDALVPDALVPDALGPAGSDS